MSLPQFDIDIYKLPIDNNDQYQTDFGEGTELLVIYNRSTSVEALSLLEGILNATKIPNDKIARLEIKNISIALSPVLRKNYIADVISFGVHPLNLGLKIPNTKYNTHKFENFNFIYSDALDKLKESKALKGQLWNSIKNNILTRTTS